MRAATIIGIILIVLGVFILAAQGITYTKTEEVIDIGPIEATAETRETIPLSPIAGGAAVAAGIVLVIVGNREKRTG